MNALSRRRHNIAHKRMLQDYRVQISHAHQDILDNKERYQKAVVEVNKFHNAQKHGLVETPKSMKMKYHFLLSNRVNELKTSKLELARLQHYFELGKHGLLEV